MADKILVRAVGGCLAKEDAGCAGTVGRGQRALWKHGVQRAEDSIRYALVGVDGQTDRAGLVRIDDDALGRDDFDRAQNAPVGGKIRID